MAAHFVVLPELKLTITKMYGAFTDADIEYLYMGLQTDKNFSSSFNRITDCRDVTASKVSFEAIQKYGRIVGKSVNIKRANLVARDEEVGTFNQYEAFANSSKDNVLTGQSVDDALEWLGLSEHSELIKSHLSFPSA